MPSPNFVVSSAPLAFIQRHAPIDPGLLHVRDECYNEPLLPAQQQARSRVTHFTAGLKSERPEHAAGFFRWLEECLQVICGLRLWRIHTLWILTGGYLVTPDGSIPKVREIHRTAMKALVE